MWDLSNDKEKAILKTQVNIAITANQYTMGRQQAARNIWPVHLRITNKILF